MRYFYFSLYVFISLLFSGCGSQWYVSTTNQDPMYDVYIPVDTTTKIDTINSLFISRENSEQISLSDGTSLNTQ